MWSVTQGLLEMLTIYSFTIEYMYTVFSVSIFFFTVNTLNIIDGDKNTHLLKICSHNTLEETASCINTV